MDKRRKIDWNAKPVNRDLRKMTPTAFAQKYKVSYPLVVKRRKVLGISQPSGTRKPVPRGFTTAVRTLPIMELAEKYHVCRSTIAEWRVQAGITGDHARGVREAQLAERIQHYADMEWSATATAKKLRISTAKVHRIARQHGLVFHQVAKDMRKVRNALMVGLVASGLSHPQVATVFNVSVQSVQQIVAAGVKH